jgi:hypothetical protein
MVLLGGLETLHSQIGEVCNTITDMTRDGRLKKISYCGLPWLVSYALLCMYKLTRGKLASFAEYCLLVVAVVGLLI